MNIDDRSFLYAQKVCAYRVWGLRLTEIYINVSCTFENRMCNLWQESKLRRKLTFWVTCKPASAQWQFKRRKIKEVETVDFRPRKNQRSHPRTFTEKQSDAPNSIQYTNWIATRKKSILKALCGRRKGFQVDNVLSEKLSLTNKFLKGSVMETMRKHEDFWIVFITETVAFRKKRTVSTNGYYGKIAGITS